MKKFLAFASFAVLLVMVAGCSVTSEKYRYQQRIDRFFNLLTQEEKTSFAAGDIVQAGNSIDKRLASDKKFADGFTAVQTEEAINTFDGQQTIRFFREIILRELNRPPFYQFMNKLDSKAQYDFAVRNNFYQDLSAKYAERDFKNFFDTLKTEYRLAGFSNQQVADFFRNISFPEVSRRELYHVLSLLKSTSVTALSAFRDGNTAAAALQLDQAISKMPVIANGFSDIRDRSSLTKVSTAQFLEIYYNVIIKEMDQGAVTRTLDKF
jgi:hypothetical protein